MQMRNKHRTSTKQSQREQLRNRGYSYVDDNTDIEPPELTPEDYDNAPYEADDLSDYEEGEERQDDIHSSRRYEIQPVWILYEGQIIWSASRFGTKLAEKEYLRRRLQLLLNFLASKFPERTHEELLLSLQGFFVRDNDNNNDSAYWMESLRNIGIVYGKGKIIAVSKFRAGKGESKSRGLIRLQKYLEYLWLEHELAKPEHKSDKPFYWGNCKGWLPEGIKDFCREINSFCRTLDGAKHDDNVHGLGFSQTEFGYQDSTLQRKRLQEWEAWWNSKEKENDI